jgi:hypothetical protein
MVGGWLVICDTEDQTVTLPALFDFVVETVTNKPASSESSVYVCEFAPSITRHVSGSVAAGVVIAAEQRCH